MRHIVIVIVCVLLSHTTLFAQKVGDIVVVIAEKEAELKDDKGKVVSTVPRGSHLQIQKVKNETFLVGYENSKGWISSADAVLFDKAIEAFSVAIKRNSKNWEDYINRGEIWGEKNEYDKAIADYTQAIKINPKSDRAYHNRGWSYFLKKEYGRALDDYNRAIAFDPNSGITFANRAMIWELRKEYKNAINPQLKNIISSI